MSTANKMVTEIKREMRNHPPVLHLTRQSQVLKLSRYTCAPTRSTMPVSADLNFWRKSCWSFITPDQQSRHHSAIIVERNIPSTHACNSCYMHTWFWSVGCNKWSHILQHLQIILFPHLLTAGWTHRMSRAVKPYSIHFFKFFFLS